MSRLLRSQIISLSVMVLASPAWAESLEDALSTAYNSNPALLSARAGLRAADEQVPQALAGWRPSVSVNGAAGRGHYMNNFSSQLPYQTQRSVGEYTLTVSQPVFSGGRTLAQTAQAESAVQAGRAQLEQTENQILLAAASSYLDVARDVALAGLYVNNQHVLERDLEMARARFKVGEITRTDVAQAEARLAQAQADRMAAEGNLQSSRAAFVALIGRPAESPQAPASSPTLPPSLEQAKAQAAADNPGIRSADWQAKAAQEAVDVIQGELLPSVALQGTMGRNVNEFLEGYESRNATGMVTVSVPLYEGGGTYARMRAQKQVWGQRLQDLDRARRDAVQMVTQGWELAQSAHARVTAFVSQVGAADLALTGVKAESTAGARTIIEVLNAEQEALGAKVNEVVARHDEWLASYQLRGAMGQMTAQALSLPVDFYDGSRHYNDVRGKWLGVGE